MTLVRAALIAACLTLTGPLLAQAEDGTHEGPRTVRETISAQLAAFRAGDADAAYAFAAPRVKRMFPTPERFVRMVRRGYAPVYYANDPVFLRERKLGEDSFAQEVGLLGPKGQSWTALYTLARQEDGSWLITGCYLRKAEGQNI